MTNPRANKDSGDRKPGDRETSPRPPSVTNTASASAIFENPNPGPVDADGFLPGCPVHNSIRHGYDDCRVTKGSGRYHHFHFLVAQRGGLPPIRTAQHSWVDIAIQNAQWPCTAYPLTCGTSRTIILEAFENYSFEPDAPLRQLGEDTLTSSFAQIEANRAQLYHSERAGSQPQSGHNVAMVDRDESGKP
ncbi:hypothetical protein F4819DRAFT_505854 [Hypoxylon fuscum]|nr:hypothetical protein F4819DRAFT_505854 [Hypoxylon fuscum]